MIEELKEIAIKANNLGFKSRTVTTIHTEKYLLGGKNTMLNEMCFYLYLCDIQEWLREKHNMLVYLLWYDDNITEARWSIYVDKIYINGNVDYKKGLEIGIKKALTLIKI